MRLTVMALGLCLLALYVSDCFGLTNEAAELVAELTEVEAEDAMDRTDHWRVKRQERRVDPRLIRRIARQRARQRAAAAAEIGNLALSLGNVFRVDPRVLRNRFFRVLTQAITEARAPPEAPPAPSPAPILEQAVAAVEATTAAAAVEATTAAAAETTAAETTAAAAVVDNTAAAIP